MSFSSLLYNIILISNLFQNQPPKVARKRHLDGKGDTDKDIPKPAKRCHVRGKFKYVTFKLIYTSNCGGED